MNNDNRLKCEIFTQNGIICPYNAYQFEKNTQKYVCKTHNKVCKDRYMQYKNICNRVARATCTDKMDEEEIIDIINFSDDCVKRRLDFSINCCERKIDSGHAWQVLSMLSLKNKCLGILADRYFPKKN